MADAIPVHSPEVAPTKPKKGASAGVSQDVLAKVKNPAFQAAESAEAPYKVSGGAELVSHKAVREDY